MDNFAPLILFEVVLMHGGNCVTFEENEKKTKRKKSKILKDQPRPWDS